MNFWMKLGSTIAMCSMIVAVLGMFLDFGLTFAFGEVGELTGVAILGFGLIKEMWFG